MSDPQNTQTIEQFRKLLTKATRADDPAKRHDAWAALLRAVPEIQKAARQERQAALQDLQAGDPNATLEEIGQRLDPPLGRQYVHDVLSGRTRTGNTARRREHPAGDTRSGDAAPAAVAHVG